MTHDLPEIDTVLVRRLLADQFPHWAGLPVRPVIPGGWDNRTFRLGETLAVRLPSAPWYAPQVDKEHAWLPVLAPHLPLPIPVPVAKGEPSEGYPFAWSVYPWLHGEPAHTAPVADLVGFAEDLGCFLTALQAVDPTGGPPPGPHTAHRGGPLWMYDDTTTRALHLLAGTVPVDILTAIWDDALTAPWEATPVWFHGDVAVGNLLVRDGHLAAVIDFGCAGVGDPSCDLVIAWTLFSGLSRTAFHDALHERVDDATWARGRGWALWKALIVHAGLVDTNTAEAAAAERTLNHLIAEYQSDFV